ncbi:Type-1 restriction enzyme EcoKI specificity protein [bioreactor metagenome]|uniref:Type-1 restriction enzyme EcoKI specificity protein n=1 Tax=bioreactor metagenome TaxID=1076179 RepID=A0A644WTC9_9ZZZZ
MINNIKAVYFHKINFPLPPLNEQKRIVAKLDAIMPRIDSVKERLEKIPAILKRFRQSVLTAAVTGKLTEKWREEHPEVESAEHLLERIREEREVRYHNACEEAKKKGAPQPKKYREIIEQNNLIKDVDTWVWTYLANVAEISGGVTKGRMLQGNDVMRLPYLRVANVQDGYLDLSEMKEIEIKKQELARYALMNGDILFTEGGDRDKLGRGCVWRSEIDVCIHQNHIFKARVNEILIVPEYIALTTRSSFSKKYFDAVASQTVNLASINMTNLCALPLLLPPLEEQKEIVRQVDKLFALADKVEEHYQKARVRVDALAQSVLAKAFRGELVSQNPDDEPAEKLLQRIREEKAKMENELKPASRSARGTRRNGTKTQGARAEEKQAGEP